MDVKATEVQGPLAGFDSIVSFGRSGLIVSSDCLAKAQSGIKALKMPLDLVCYDRPTPLPFWKGEAGPRI